jgi:ribosome-dependent ATPase
MDSASPDVAVRFSDMSHRYKKVQALKSISLEIPSGQMIGLLGPDGVGKSTLLGLMSGARKLQSGKLEVLGADMSKRVQRKLVGPRIAYMPQGLGKNLYSTLSIQENLDFFGKLFGQSRSERTQRIHQLTSATDLSPFLSRPAGKLSGGMKQKLGLCCALLHDPDLLILDEPTTGVDPLSRRQLWQLIDTIIGERPSMSVIVSTAYMDEAELFDWLIAMNMGTILATGTPQQLKEATGTEDVEHAFIKLMPEEKQEQHSKIVIPPLADTDHPPAIVARNLTRRFGDFTAVDRVSFDIQVGEIFGFLGSNGCGKTTTMKMLTGLLPASEGEAFLFNQPVNARNIETRKRVGFMSQSFSLYGELTVDQNLLLHARLFHLSRERTSERMETLRQQFGLLEYRDQLASSLPLGVRQRLSLAVAIIHEPEMLILDEPTSGVDPVARDNFWQLLIELSRKDRVTIFISTHFMSEAVRCDRISLMHAGKVLVYDKPDHLVESKGCKNLEEAFIRYIEEYIETTGENRLVEQTEPTMGGTIGSNPVDSVARITPKKQHQFSLSRMLAYTYKETVELIRDRVRLAFALVGTMFLLILISYGVSQDVENLTFAALDLDQTPESRNYVNQLDGSRFFIEQQPLMNVMEMESRLKSGDITMAIEIPHDFGRKLTRGEQPEVSAWVDGANTVRAGNIESYVVGGHWEYLASRARQRGVDLSQLELATVEPRFRYNPTLESIYATGPAVPAFLLMMFPAILMAVSVAREKEIGTITNFYVTPTSRLEFLLGKQLPYIVIGFLNFLILCVLVVLVLQVPFKGSLLTLSVGAILYLAASTGYGLFVSSFTKSQVAAVFAAAILSMLPTMQFSGMIQPVSTLEGSARLMGTLWPTTYYLHMSVGAFTKGLEFHDLIPDLIALIVFVPVFTLIAAILLRKQEK